MCILTRCLPFLLTQVHNHHTGEAPALRSIEKVSICNSFLYYEYLEKAATRNDMCATLKESVVLITAYSDRERLVPPDDVLHLRTVPLESAIFVSWLFILWRLLFIFQILVL